MQIAPSATLPLCLARAPLTRLIDRLEATHAASGHERPEIVAVIKLHASRYGVPMDLTDPDYQDAPGEAYAALRAAFAEAGA
jgi:hypothetical protein